MKTFLTFHPFRADAPKTSRQGGEEPQLLRADYESGALYTLSHLMLTRLLGGVLKRRRLWNRKVKLNLTRSRAGKWQSQFVFPHIACLSWKAGLVN